MSAEPAKKWRHEHTWFLIEVLLILVVSCVAHGFHGTALAHWLEESTAEQVQGMLPKADLKDVRVIDTHGLTHLQTRTPGISGISRSELSELIGKIREAGPKGIGVDVDFSLEWLVPVKKRLPNGQEITKLEIIRDIPEKRGAYAVGQTFNGDEPNPNSKESDTTLLAMLLREKEGDPPVYLGVMRQLEAACGLWFFTENEPDGCKLGAALPLFKNSTAVVPIEIQRMDGERVRTMTSRLAGLLPRAQESTYFYSDRLAVRRRETAFESALVDYTRIDNIKRISGLDILENGLSNELKKDLFKKLILIGDCAPDPLLKQDLFKVPGKGDHKYAGVLVHACATQTLVSAPLRVLTNAGALTIELVLFSLLALGVMFFEIRMNDSGRSKRVPPGVTALNVAAATICLSLFYLAATQWRVVWLDLLLLLTVHFLIFFTVLTIKIKSHKHGDTTPSSQPEDVVDGNQS
ncbi:MAG: CHASE2 domain-containing protein [Chlorobia bacterium]|nr:CHASE2 domain-containing protein [Fimbriimonadaceae bacterium]